MAVTTAYASEDKNNNRENLSDRSIMFPAGVDANTKEMATNWYLKNFTNLNETNLRGRLVPYRNDNIRIEPWH